MFTASALLSSPEAPGRPPANATQVNLTQIGLVQIDLAQINLAELSTVQMNMMHHVCPVVPWPRTA